MSSIPVSHSSLLDYASQLLYVSIDEVKRVSLGEGARIVPGALVEGVEIDFLDLSSPTPTGTFKDWLACVTLAECLRDRVDCFVTQSSANTGVSLVRYARDQGVRIVLFYPEVSRYKLPATLAQEAHACIIEVAAPEPEIKRITARFAQMFGLPQLPTFTQQIEANKLRAHLLAEYCARTQVKFEWHVQALSAAYGLFGFYAGLDEIGRTAQPVPVSRPLGVQQEAVCPYAAYLRSTEPGSVSVDRVSAVATVEPTLFRTEPTGEMLLLMARICSQYRGTVVSITNEQFARLRPRVLEVLGHAELEPVTCVRNGRLLVKEQAPTLAMAGLLQAVDDGRVTPGERALVVVTGGAVAPNWSASEFQPRRRLVPPCSDQDLSELGKALGLSAV